MRAQVKVRSRVQGLNAILLENDALLVTILPDVGAKIYDLIWKPTGRNFLWHNPRIAPQPYAIEANFDNYWSGGWDEAFPTCDECVHAGEHYPNLGELRSLHWKIEGEQQTDNGAMVQLTAFGPISPIQARKTLRIYEKSSVVRVHSEIANLGPLPIDFIWGTHPAIDPGKHAVLYVPAEEGIVGLASHPSLGIPGQRYHWPVIQTATGETNMSVTQPRSAGIFCGHYATGLEGGWYAIEDLDTGHGFLLQFPFETCPLLWMWLVYGGWRGYRHVILEPWTSFPVNLAEATKQGTHRTLKSGEKFVVQVSAAIYSPPVTRENVLQEISSLEDR